MADASSLSGPEPPGGGIASGIIIQVEPSLPGVRLLGVASRAICLQSLSEDEASEMELALVEAATNVVKHGFNEVPEGQLAAEFKIDEASIEVVLRDNGPEFNPLTAPASTPWAEGNDENFDDLPENGFGLGLIIELTDTQSYQRDNEQNALSLSKTHKPASN
tara:strand:- start:642 stop:1130 length:489 start_codon:yes stop_codon:yes gene_type:complete